MTTYPLSEPATIYAVEACGDVTSDVVGRGTLEACMDIVAGLPSDQQKSVSIRMDALDLKFGPQEIGELQEFLRKETAGLSNGDITEIKTSSL
ncbi:hypothetical protein [Sphingomonas albertensis]|uniref:Uncharacterized protein n=1 Tax=Sphingomonas albertensis TaxID=2762591 RepID=A0ABR7AI55_9SPHN|nr:hypothetical protein [Sphingomonas albertensis]MBC3940136.1 hypothetical protein [Sphingomonas albertensis]